MLKREKSEIELNFHENITEIKTQLLNNSKISQELRSTILTKAAELEKESKKKKKN